MAKKEGKPARRCWECEHLKIVYEPLKAPTRRTEHGLARCDKHSRMLGFANRSALDAMTCEGVSGCKT